MEVVYLLDIPSSSYVVFKVGYVATSVHDDMIYVYMRPERKVRNSVKVNGSSTRNNVHVHVRV